MYIPAAAKKAIKIFLVAAFFLIENSPVAAQSARSIIKGIVTDKTTSRPVFGVQVTEAGRVNFVRTDAAGKYLLKVSKGVKKLNFSLKGYQTKQITEIAVKGDETQWLDIVLMPIAQATSSNTKSRQTDSLNSKDSLAIITFLANQNSPVYNLKEFNAANVSEVRIPESVGEGTAKDLTGLLQSLNGVVLLNLLEPLQPVSFSVNGMGDRYNQLLLNNAVVGSSDQYSRRYSLDMIPAEMVEKLSVSKTADASLPGDYAGGSIAVTTKDLPDKNYFYLHGSGGVFNRTFQKDFFSDKGNTGQFLSFPGSARSLPASFPTTRSIAAFNQHNLQEQLFYSQQLANNLAPVNNGNAKLADKISVGFGKILRYKKGVTAGITGFVGQQKSEQFFTNTAQVSVNAGNNPFPFTDGTKVLVRSASYDSTYAYASQFNAALNATVLYGNSKVSIKSLYASQFLNEYSSRSGVSAPDADPMAIAGLYYKTTQRKFLNVQATGEHALGPEGKLKLDWQATYSLYQQQSPDERNFILRVDTPGNSLFEIGTRTGPATDITNSGRFWKNLREYNYTGAFNLSFPFNMFRRSTVLSGGILISTRYRVTHNDLFITNGTGFFTLNTLLAPEQNFPGRLSIINYFSNSPVTNAASRNLNDRSGYVATANLGAAYIKIDNRITNKLLLNLGIRAESNSQLVSSTAYSYTTGFRYPQLRTLDVNNSPGTFSLLPSATLKYQLLSNIELQGGFYRTLSRPQLQELSIFREYDPLSFLIRTGNQQLRTSHIENFYAGAGWIIRPGSVVNATAFYKKIDLPVENILTNYGQGTILSQPYNAPPATVKGVTVSANVVVLSSKKTSLNKLSLFASATYADAVVQAGPLKSTAAPFVLAHSLSGTPAWSGNGGLVFKYSKLPQISLQYSYSGDHIIAVGSGTEVKLVNGNAIAAVPHYRIKSNEQLNIQLSQLLFKSRLQVAAGINNLLNGQYVVYQDLNGNKKMDEPLLLGSFNDKPGYYRTGTDNTISSIKTQQYYYLTLSFLFR